VTSPFLVSVSIMRSGQNRSSGQEVISVSAEPHRVRPDLGSVATLRSDQVGFAAPDRLQ
ncbi:uncharacterized protein METZ01_LOCUS184912, partial [marine metagenome]